MALTDDEITTIVEQVFAKIQEASQSVDELEEVTSLDGVTSLPAMKNSEAVSVPISLLGEPAETAAEAANSAATSAKSAADSASSAAAAADSAAEKATSAASAAISAASAATTAKESLDDVASELRGTVVNVNRVLGVTTQYAGIAAVAQAIVDGGITAAQQDGVVLIYLTSDGWTAMQYTAPSTSSSTTFVDADNWDGFGSGSGSGSGFYNVTVEQPLAEGYYDLGAAVAALKDAGMEEGQMPGMIITFLDSSGKWEDYRFTGTSTDSFYETGSWEEYTPLSVQSIVLNGETIIPDEEGKATLNIEVPEVDDSLNENSSNAIANSAVAAAIAEIEDNTVVDSDVEIGDETTVVTLLNASAGQITSFEIPNTGGSGDSSDSSTTKIVLTAVVDNSTVRAGDSAALTYAYDHQYSSGDDAGESTGTNADIEIVVKRGSTTLATLSYSDVESGSYTVDLTDCLTAAGTVKATITATAISPEGNTQTKKKVVSVMVSTLSLSSSYTLSNKLSAGGYATSETVSIPYTVTGSSAKVVTIYLDGEEYNTASISKSGTSNGSFSIPCTPLAAGRHNVQMVAEMEVGSITLLSQSVYIDFLVQGSDEPYIGTMISFDDGRIFTDNYLTPTIAVGCYKLLTFGYVAYDPDGTPASMDIYRDGTKLQTVSVARTTQTYTNRYTETGDMEMKFVCGDAEYLFYISVEESGIDISEVTDSLVLKLTADGRSNTEDDPAVWIYGDTDTVFTGFDWSSNGWDGEKLNVTNGAKAEIGYQPFSSDPTANGATYEFELACTHVTDKDGVILSCMSGGVGFQMTAHEALLVASGGSEVSTKFAEDIDLRIGFVVNKKSDTRLLELYVNGIRCGAYQYASSESLLQESPSGITIDSDAADVSLRSIRVYEKALSDDEMLENYIVDRPTTDEMVTLYEENEVMDDEGEEIDIDKLRTMGKSVIRFVGDVDLVNETNNKKFEVSVDVYYYSAYGSAYDFIAIGAGLRIQGTSSTTYPRKNYRLYLDRCSAFYLNGVAQEMTTDDQGKTSYRYSFKEGARPSHIFCFKADFSDSSSTHNTGATTLVNDVWKQCGFLTPVQEAYDGDYDVRIGVDGFPCDGFYDNDATNENKYLGKFNFNNEKSECFDVYGFEGVEGYNDRDTLAGAENPCICLEFLDNSAPLCLFTTDDMADFDDVLEFRFHRDSSGNLSDGWDGTTEYAQTAVQRLWSWVVSCKDAPDKFAEEVSRYFDVNFLCAWYLYTEYFMAVDQRAKNMMLCTWDGEIWYFLPYDSDTILGERNDSVLAYDYTITEETYDDSISSYAYAGHDSLLWSLVRESLADTLMTTAQTIRSVMSISMVLTRFNETQMGNWSERVYNKDGYFKYIQPLVEGVNGTNYNYLYALHGSRYAHREFTINNRFALLDAKYVAGTYKSDSFTVYFGYTFSTDNRSIKIVSSERYYFGYGYTSGTPTMSGVLAEAEGSEVELPFTGDLIVNDPQYVYGASRIRDLDLSDISLAILQTLNLNNCTALRVLNLSCATVNTTLNSLIVTGCTALRTLTIDGLQSSGLTGLDLSCNTKLQYFSASRTVLTGVSFAAGAPLATVVLPATLQTLELSSLNGLTNDGLTLEGTDNITRLVVDSCALIDWAELLEACANVKYVRITGIDMEGDGTLLKSLLSMGGVDEEGANVSDSCRLVGDYRLTQYMDEDDFATVTAHYPELNITQPQYTMIEFDDEVSDDANVSNLDNGTGYKYGSDYEPSGHISAILKQRHRVLAKVTKKPTTRSVNMANVDTTVNNLDGEMTYYPLDDTDSNKYADGTAAALDGSEGDWMMYEPFFWSKGVNDYLNGKHYSCYSSNGSDNMPEVPEATVLTLDDIKGTSGGYLSGRKIMSGRETLSDSYSTDSTYSVCKVSVAGYKKVRFPSVPGTNLVGSIFTDDAGTVISSIVVPTLSNKFEAGMYLISEVPTGATALHFSILNTAEFDKVVLSNSDKIEDLEPDWVANDEHLCAVVGSSVVGTQLRACITGGSTVASLPWSDFHYYSAQRGMQQIDALMHSRIANLFYAKYGRRDSQEQCGAGSHSNNRTTGGTASRGMTDTIGYEEASGINANITNSLVEDSVHQYAWYRSEDGGATVTQVNNTCCLGYEDIYGHKYDMMDGVDLPNDTGNSGKWRIWMPDGSIRMVKGKTASDQYTTAVAHGKYMDVVPVGSVAGSSSTYYCDKYYISTASCRVVYRGSSYAYPNGGVSMSYASYDSSSTYTYIGSRLAFRGRLVRASSAAAFKSVSEVA